MTPRQCAAARALLRWKRATLVHESGVCLSSVSAFENGSAGLRRANLRSVRKAFHRAGVLFIGAAGVVSVSGCAPPASPAMRACEMAAFMEMGLERHVPGEEYAGNVAFEGRRSFKRTWVRCEMDGNVVTALYLDGSETPVPITPLPGN